MTRQLEPKTGSLTDGQRDRLVKTIQANKTISNVDALLAAGVTGTRGELRALVKSDEDLADTIRTARGYGRQQIRNEIRDRAFAGADDQASGRLLLAMAKAYLPEYRDAADLNVSVAGRLEVEDRSAPIDALYRVLQAVGAVDGGAAAQRALPAAGEVLAEPAES